jgi:hypothetical protein
MKHGCEGRGGRRMNIALRVLSGLAFLKIADCQFQLLDLAIELFR